MFRCLALVAVPLLGCMPAPFPEDNLPTHQERPVDAILASDFNVVWEATLEILGDAGPIEEIDESKGLIVTGWVHGASDYIYKNFAGTKMPWFSKKNSFRR